MLLADRSRLRSIATKVVAGTAAVACLFGGAAYADTPGIDVSKWQHDGPTTSLNWEKVRADGVTFTFIKATEAANYTNPWFAGDWAGARRAGVYRGAYHFARPSVGSAARQARYFVGKAGTFAGRGVLPPVLDLEATGGLGVASLREWTRTWLQTVTRLTGRRPIIYTSPYFWESELGDASNFTDYRLWVAHYDTTHPRVPGGWKTWTFWQRSSTGRIDGISGAVDINRFNGTRAQLAVLAHAGGTGGGVTDPGTGTSPDPGTPGTDDGTGDPSTEPVPSTPTEPAPQPAPVKTATAVSLRLSADTVFSGLTVDFAGRLRTATGEPLAGRHVALYRRADATSTWTRIATPTTDTDGRYAVSFSASASADFWVTYAGTTRYAESASARRGLTVRPKIVTAPTLAQDTAARRGRTAKVYGHLLTRSGRAVVGRTMYLYQRPAGSSRWTLVERSETLSPSGWYQAYVKPSRTSTYKAVFKGGTAFAPSVSNVTTVRVR